MSEQTQPIRPPGMPPVDPSLLRDHDWMYNMHELMIAFEVRSEDLAAYQGEEQS